MMDNKPSRADSPSPAATEDQSSAVSSSSPASLLSISTSSASNLYFLRDVFVGPDGIYALPRVVIYLGMAYAVFKTEGWLLLPILSHSNALWWRLAAETSMMLSAILPGLVVAKIEGQRFGEFGLPASGAFGRNFWVGTFWGIASLTVLMLVLRASGTFTFGALDLHGKRIVKFGLYYALLFLITGLFEEFLLRGYSQWALTQGINFWPAAVLLSISFGAIHGTNPGEARSGLVAAGLIGFFFCLTLRRTGDLWWAVGFHMAWDWGESFFYSVPDSGAVLPGHLFHSSLHGPVWLTGGSVGPEGSYLVFVVIGALWVLFGRAYPEVKYGANRVTLSSSSSS